MTQPITPGDVPSGWPVPQQPEPPAGVAPGAAPPAPWPTVPQQGYPAGYAPPPAYYPPPGYYPPGYFPPGYAPTGYGPPGYGPGMVAPPVLVGGLPLASFADRFLGYLIDSVIKGIVLGIPAFITLYFVVFKGFFQQMSPLYPGEVPDIGSLFRKELLAFAIILPIYLIGSYIYDVLLMYSSGQTVGKRVMKTRIVRVADGGPITMGLATRRWFIENVCGYVPGLVYLDCLWLLWDKPYQQCLHDKFARTTVVKVDQVTAAGMA